MAEFSDNTAQSRFEHHVDGHIAFATYRITGETLFIDYVEAPLALRGSGAAGRLMEYVMQQVKARNLKAVPICGYAASWLKKHESEYTDLIG